MITLEEVQTLRARAVVDLQPQTRKLLADNEAANRAIAAIDGAIAEHEALLFELRTQRIRQVARADYSMELAVEAERATKEK